MSTDGTDELADDDDDDALVELPGFAVGGRVTKTGLAVVHRGEYLVPADGSEAEVTHEPKVFAGGQVIHYHFPIEIEVVGTLGEEHVRRVARHVYEELGAALRSRV
jgi:hypothetical protein